MRWEESGGVPEERVVGETEEKGGFFDDLMNRVLNRRRVCVWEGVEV
jgi:hypothetical protein